jgi:hypothetical protein
MGSEGIWGAGGVAPDHLSVFRHSRTELTSFSPGFESSLDHFLCVRMVRRCGPAQRIESQ